MTPPLLPDLRVLRSQLERAVSNGRRTTATTLTASRRGRVVTPHLRTLALWATLGIASGAVLGQSIDQVRFRHTRAEIPWHGHELAIRDGLNELTLTARTPASRAAGQTARARFDDTPP